MNNVIGKMSRLCLMMSVISSAIGLQADTAKFEFDIDGSKAGQALVELGQYSGVQIIFTSDVVDRVKLADVSGIYTLAEALDTMLRNSGLIYEFISDDSVVIKQSVSSTVEPDGERDSQKTREVEEMIVTAQRREQSLQEVPIAISAFGSRDIEVGKITDVGDYFDRTPNVNFSDAGGQRQSRKITMRGIAKLAGNNGSNTFGFYLDEFNLASTSVNPSIMDVERIEVLRGPQSTYFGRGAVGGAVNIVTNKPAPEFYGKVGLGVSSFDTYQVDGVVNMPLTDTFFVRASGNFEISDGFVKNVNPVGGSSSHDYKNSRIAFRWLATERLTMDVAYTRSDETQDILEQVPTGIVEPNLIPTFVTEADLAGTGAWPENKDKVNLDFPDISENVMDIYTAKLTYENDDIIFSSVTGFIDRDWFANRDLDFSGQDGVPTYESWEYEDFSQEFRLQSASSDTLEWAVGVVYAKFNLEYNQDAFAGADFFGGAFQGLNISDYLQIDESETKALFGEVTWHVGDRLSLTAGGRYTRETTDSKIEYISFFVPSPQVLGETDTNDISPRFAITYDMTDDFTGFMTVSKGFKSGGVQPGNAYAPTFDKEELWNYEVGVKGSVLDNRLRFGLSLFEMEWNDLQVSARENIVNPDGTISIIFATTNAAKATSRGVELDLSALLSDDLEFYLTAGYNDAHFDQYENAVLAYGGVADLSGKQIPNSTRFNLSSGAQYNFNVGGDNDAYVRAEYVYRSRYHSTLTSLVSDHPYYDQIPSRGVFNLRGGFDWGRYSVSAFVENVFEEDWYTGSNDNLSYSGRLITPHPRRVGIRIQTEFD